MDFTILPKELQTVIQDWQLRQPFAETKKGPRVFTHRIPNGEYYLIFTMCEILKFADIEHVTDRLQKDSVDVVCNRHYEVCADQNTIMDYVYHSTQLDKALKELEIDFSTCYHNTNKYLGDHINKLS